MKALTRMEDPKLIAAPDERIVIIVRVHHPVGRRDVERQRGEPHRQLAFVRAAHQTRLALDLRQGARAET